VHNVRIWSNRFGAGRDLVFRVLARLDNSSRASEGRVNLRYPRGRPQLVIDGKHIKWEPKRIGKVKLDGIQRLWLDQLYVEDESRWVYAPSDDVHVLEAVRPPSASDRSKPRDR
jgi:hypothetical protein